MLIIKVMKFLFFILYSYIFFFLLVTAVSGHAVQDWWVLLLSTVWICILIRIWLIGHFKLITSHVSLRVREKKKLTMVIRIMFTSKNVSSSSEAENVYISSKTATYSTSYVKNTVWLLSTIIYKNILQPLLLLCIKVFYKSLDSAVLYWNLLYLSNIIRKKILTIWKIWNRYSFLLYLYCILGLMWTHMSVCVCVCARVRVHVWALSSGLEQVTSLFVALCYWWQCR